MTVPCASSWVATWWSVVDVGMPRVLSLSSRHRLRAGAGNPPGNHHPFAWRGNGDTRAQTDSARALARVFGEEAFALTALPALQAFSAVEQTNVHTMRPVTKPVTERMSAVER